MTPPAAVAVQPLSGFEKLLGYKVPGPMQEKIGPGSLVRIPLLNRMALGVVESLEAPPGYPARKLKYIREVVQPFPVLTPDLLALAKWMKTYYAASSESVYEAMMPGAVRKGMKAQKRVFIRLARRLETAELEALRKKAPKQAAICECLAVQQLRSSIPRQTVLNRLRAAASSCEALIQKGIVEETLEPVERCAYDDEMAQAEHVPHAAFDLNDEQQAAAEDICRGLDSGQFKVHLLHGVTGSGKTEVYFKAVRKALALGGGALYLVPEVALTPQTAGRLRSRLQAESGARAAVWHSHLPDGERLDAWRALASGETRVVVGARSAVFAPVKNLRLVIVDEEHEPAYKQDETPRYHGRNVAVYRARLNNAVCVLGSATPSLESLFNAQQGKYRLNLLTKRVDDRQLPFIHIVDMKREVLAQKGGARFSRLLADKMRNRFENGEQTILFLNRRGFHTTLLCPECGHAAECGHCSLTLTHHRAAGVLRCHLCGSEKPAPDRCPKCRSRNIQWKGSGTQRIEDAAGKFLPKARIARVDTDAMRRKNLLRAVLGDFRRGKIDVLVGTQMIAKGLDFPNVTLVGLLDADMSLHIPDFRSAERTFQLLVQVAGRSGRGDRAGEVVVQSFIPHSPAVQYARRQDFEGFSELELGHRREYRYPPFRHLIHHVFRSKNPEKATFYAEHFARLAEKKLAGEGLEIRGPAPCPIEKIKGCYRLQVWYFTGTVSKTVPKIAALRKAFKMDKDVIDVLDVDPVSLT